MFANEKVSIHLLRVLQSSEARKALSTITDHYISAKVLMKFYPDLKVSELNKRWVREFDNKLYNTKYSPNTVWKHHKNIRSMLEVLVAEDVIPSNPYNGFTPHQTPGEKIVVSEEDIEQLKNAQLDGELVVFRDIFLLGYYSLLRVSDLLRISSHHLVEENGTKYIRIHTQKTGGKVIIPAGKIVQGILETYPTGFNMYRSMINTGIKNAFKAAGLTRPVEVQIFRKYEGSVKKVYTTSPLWRVVTIHCARRAGITAMIRLGIPSQSVMLISGHKTETALMSYVGITQQQNAEVLSTNKFFNV